MFRGGGCGNRGGRGLLQLFSKPLYNFVIVDFGPSKKLEPQDEDTHIGTEVISGFASTY